MFVSIWRKAVFTGNPKVVMLCQICLAGFSPVCLSQFGNAKSVEAACSLMLFSEEPDKMKRALMSSYKCMLSSCIKA
jgi:hypothetical protein